MTITQLLRFKKMLLEARATAKTDGDAILAGWDAENMQTLINLNAHIASKRRT